MPSLGGILCTPRERHDCAHPKTNWVLANVRTSSLQRLSPDGTTYVTVIPAFTAVGYTNQFLPGGTYRLTIATTTAVYADVVATKTTQ
jgi:hypothetical protein